MKKIFVIFFQFLYFSTLNADINFNYYLNKAMEKNLQLNLQLESILYAADENKNLRELLDFKRETKLKIIPASIINKGIQTNIKALTIDVGSRDSVFTNQAVLTQYGVIGKTIQVGKHSAIVQSFSDNNFHDTKFVEKIVAERFYKNSYYIVQYGWKKEAVPIVQEKKSIISGFFDKIFS